MKRTRFALYSSAFTFLLASLHAQTIVRCNKLLDVRQGKYIDNAVISIENDRIVDIGTAAKVAGSGARVIEVPGTCVPGLIDVHVHLTSDPEEGGFGYSELGVSIPQIGRASCRESVLIWWVGV